MINTKKNVQIIFGPTASGKSLCAIQRVQKSGGVIINADATQLYAELRILSARPSEADEKEAPHLLYGVVQGSENASVAWWVQRATEEIQKAWERKETPVLCGGTGMYLAALMEGISEIPAVPAEVRQQVAEMQNGELHSVLQKHDPQMAAKLKEGDTQRLRRACEVWFATGQSLSAWQQAPKKRPLPEAEWQVTLLNPPRAALYERINQRFLQMMEMGAEEEVRALMAKGYPASHPIMKAVGVPEISAYLRGEISKEAATEIAQQHSRNYAKRQITWLKNQFHQRFDSSITD